ncbi:hypothetical protein DITRI_Ditri11bG0102000 [Diplodiscus trichospermus]
MKNAGKPLLLVGLKSIVMGVLNPRSRKQASGWSSAILKGSSLMVVARLSKPIALLLLKHLLLMKLRDIREKLKQIPFCQFQWIKRKANQAADWIATQTISRKCRQDWVLHPPSSVVHILNKDGLPTPHCSFVQQSGCS